MAVVDAQEGCFVFAAKDYRPWRAIAVPASLGPEGGIVEVNHVEKISGIRLYCYRDIQYLINLRLLGHLITCLTMIFR